MKLIKPTKKFGNVTVLNRTPSHVTIDYFEEGKDQYIVIEGIEQPAEDA